MTGHEDYNDLLGGYVLGALPAEEMKVMREHLASCPACREERERLAGVLPLLELAGPAAERAELRDPGLEAVVVERYRRGRRRRGWLRMRDVVLGSRGRAAAAGAVVGAAVTLTLIALLGAPWDDGREPTTVGLVGSAPARTASGEVDLRPTDSGTRVELRVDGLRPTRSAELYELWLVSPRGRTSAGTFRVPPSGSARAEMTAAVSVDELLALGVTLEPDDGDPARNGPNVLAGEIDG